MRYERVRAIGGSWFGQNRVWPIGVFVAASAMTSAGAQDTDSVIIQIPSSAATSRPSGQQLSSSRVDGGTSVQTDGQLSSLPGTGRTPVGLTPPQLTRDRRQVRTEDEFHGRGRSVQGTEPLSSPSDGRTSAVARVEGRDRCDRAQTDSVVICARAIETRSGEFAKPQAVALSPEQRLLIVQPLRDGQETIRTASQRLAGDGQAQTIEEQSVASVALRQGNNAVRPAAADAAGLPVLSAEAQAFVNALVGSSAISPPRP